LAVTVCITGKVKLARRAELAVRVIGQSTVAPLQGAVSPVPLVQPVKVEPLFAVARITKGVGFG
jgi:hypothetical protein